LKAIETIAVDTNGQNTEDKFPCIN